MTFLLLAICMGLPLSDLSSPILQGEVEGQPAEKMVYSLLLKQAKDKNVQRKERFESLKSREDIAAYQDSLRTFFVAQLGGFPERTPLNARTVEQGERELFRYEKIIFESQPGLFVTGLLFLPKTGGPWPGVIVPCGHSANGKANEPYQRVSILLAINGMAAFCYDPIGQGERYAFLKENNLPEFGSTLEHCLVGIGAILTGTNAAKYRIWDGMRAIDYLCSRSDILPDKIGCTGNSGGGTLTSYLMALDDRIQCAAPSCYLTSFDRLLNTIGPQDAEQDIFGQLAFGMDHADYIHQRAPKPTLICAATEDFFDISGTWDTFREAKRIYSILGLAEQVDLIENNGKHGFSQPQREAAVRWMRRWLLDDYQPMVEPEFAILTEEEAQCTPEGQVMLLEGARSVLDLNRERADQLATQRKEFLSGADRTALHKKVCELIGVLPEPVAAASAEEKDAKIMEGIEIKRMTLAPEPGVTLPAVLAIPEGFSGKYELILDELGKENAFSGEGAATRALREGNAAFVVEVRSTGETLARQEPKGWNDYVGSNWQDYFLAYLLGESMVGMRVTDIAVAFQHLNAQLKPGESIVRIWASGNLTVPALHAVALYPDLFGPVSLVLRDGIPSWDAVVRADRPRHQLINAVHNALAWYDLPVLETVLAPGQVIHENACVPEF